MKTVSKMMRRGVIYVAILAIALTSIWASATAQSADERFFTDTGHRVSGAFYAFYTQTPNPLQMFGFPITGQFHTRDGVLIQYFQKARFELDRDGRVRLTPLGSLVREVRGPGKPTDSVQSGAICQRFVETGFSVCFDFLRFFQDNGGVEQFGLPISGIEWVGDRMVQWFQNARLEWHPELLSGQKIFVAELGYEYFEIAGENPQLQLPEFEPNFAPKVITDLSVRAFVTRDISANGYDPMLYVIVQDQNNQPLENASVEFILRYADGRAERFIMSSVTNRYGFTNMAFPVNTSRTGIVELEVKATFIDLEKETRTSFRIWY